jgi:hypothetical protein
MTTGSTPSRHASDVVGTEMRFDTVRRHLLERLHHRILQADGSAMPCEGPGFCRECNRQERNKEAAISAGNNKAAEAP